VGGIDAHPSLKTRPTKSRDGGHTANKKDGQTRPVKRRTAVQLFGAGKKVAIGWLPVILDYPNSKFPETLTGRDLSRTRPFQVLTFKCLSVDQLTLRTLNYLNSAMLTAL
jgi:hypothetical protein